MGSAFDIKAVFDVVVAIADAAVPGGRDDEKGINIHAKTFRSKEGEERRTLWGCIECLAQIRISNSRNLWQNPHPQRRG